MDGKIKIRRNVLISRNFQEDQFLENTPEMPWRLNHTHGVPQCENFMIFLSFRFYVKSICGNLEVPSHFRGSEFSAFGEFQPSKSAKILKTQNSEPLNVSKWQILHL